MFATRMFTLVFLAVVLLICMNKVQAQSQLGVDPALCGGCPAGQYCQVLYPPCVRPPPDCTTCQFNCQPLHRCVAPL